MAPSTGIGTAVAFGCIGNVLSLLAASPLLEMKVSPTLVFVAMAAPLLVSLLSLAAFHAASKETAAE